MAPQSTHLPLVNPHALETNPSSDFHAEFSSASLLFSFEILKRVQEEFLRVCTHARFLQK